MKSQNPSTRTLTENITRRRFIKRTGAATVVTAFAFNAFNVYGAVETDCMCFTVTVPEGQTLPISIFPPTSVAKIKDQLKDKNYTSADCGSKKANLQPGQGSIEKVPPGPMPDPVNGVVTLPPGTYKICVRN